MWGKHVEHTIREATKDAKNEKERERRSQSAMRRLMNVLSEEEQQADSPAPTPPKGAFRDPANIFKK